MLPEVLGIISREYPPETHVGGIGTFSEAAATLLSERGWKVHVFCLGKKPSVSVVGNLTVHRIPMGNHPLPTPPWLYPLRHWVRRHAPKSLEALTWALTVSRYLKAISDQLGLTRLEYPETNAEGFAAARSLGKRVFSVARIHSSSPLSAGTGPFDAFLLRRLQRMACRRADRVISPSRYSASVYARNELGWRGHVYRIPNPLRIAASANASTTEKDSPWRLLFLGRREYRKGLDLILTALDALGPEAEGWELRIAGAEVPEPSAADTRLNQALEAALRRQVEGILPYRLKVLGSLPHERALEECRACGILCLPSRSENLSYAGLEAMSQGCFLLASDAGGNPELLEGGRHGCLFRTGDADDLAAKMRELRRDPQRIRAAWKGNPSLMAEAFDPAACARDLEDTYADQEPAGTSRLLRVQANP